MEYKINLSNGWHEIPGQTNVYCYIKNGIIVDLMGYIGIPDMAPIERQFPIDMGLYNRILKTDIVKAFLEYTEDIMP